MTTAQLAKLLAGVDPAVLGQLLGPKVKTTKAQMLSNKDKAIRSAFTKRGVKDVVLMDRNDRDAPFNVRPYGKVNEDGSKSGWLGFVDDEAPFGRRVKKGEKAVKGLFHISQTEALAE